MNLRGIANRVSSVVNPNIPVTLYRSTGYTIGAGRKQVPGYADPVEVIAQLQALDGNDLKQLDSLNIQGTIKAIYLYGIVAGVVRPDGTGGDKIIIDHRTWLVVKVLEGWATWTKAAIVLQDDPDV
jgi:hypothetical protein